MDTINPHHIVLWRDIRDGKLHLNIYVCESLYTADMLLATEIISVPWDRAHTITRWIRSANWLTEAERALTLQQVADLLAVYDITPIQD